MTLYNLLPKHPSEVTTRRLALTAALLRKGRSAGEIADTSRAIYRSLGEPDRETFQRLRTLRAQLATLSLGGPGKLSPSDYQARLGVLRVEGDTLEAELAKRSSVLRAQQQLPGPTDVISRVAAILPSNGALIEIVAFWARPVVLRPGTVPSQRKSAFAYLALILLPHGEIRVADLGPAEIIDRAARRLHLALTSQDAGYLDAAQELYRLVFAPIAPLLGAQRRLFLSPDGQLSLVPFAILHDGKNFLVDAYDMTYLASGRDLLHRPEDATRARGVVVFADPEFDAKPSPLAMHTDSTPAEPGPETPERSYAVERFFVKQRTKLSDLPWEPLPGTRQEAEAIRKFLPHAELMMGRDATKGAFLQVAAPKILHVATHGFFLQDMATPPATRGADTFGELAGGKPHQIPSDPLLRSGLVLAGARSSVAGSGDVHSPLEDSLVTALEVAGMDLWGTQLVVLSACETGQGDVHLGQGVYGLRRAFTVAGAETVVMSLWKVDDATTRELMEGYYQRLLAGQGRAGAMRQAMAVVRAQHPHPYYWAPFIVVGNGAPLRGLVSQRAIVERKVP